MGAGRKKAIADHFQSSILHVLCSDGVRCLSLLLTNDHSGLSGLKQHKRIILQFWRLEVQNRSWGLKSRCGQRRAPSGGLRGICCGLCRPPRRLAALGCGRVTPILRASLSTGRSAMALRGPPLRGWQAPSAPCRGNACGCTRGPPG